MRSKGIAFSLSFAAFIALSPVAIPISEANANDCVRTVRALSDFTIQGDAWTWWNTAAGQYDRDRRPALGSVLVFKRSGRLNRGHVSLVSNVIDRRTIEVDHTWLEGRGIRRHMRVMDVSHGNDWSAVRVWHDPSDQFGLRVYATYGFILPEGQNARSPVLEANERGIDSGFSVAPAGRGAKRSPDTVRLLQASVKAPAGSRALVTAPVTAIAVPGRKPQILHASHTAAPAARAVATTEAVLPRRKPSTPAAAATKGAAASVDGLRTLMPGRKPGAEVVAELVSGTRGE